MSSYVLNLIIFGVAYAVLVYFMFFLLRKNKMKNKDDDDDKNGGIEILSSPDGDLPPTIGLPNGGPSEKIKKEDREEAIIN